MRALVRLRAWRGPLLGLCVAASLSFAGSQQRERVAATPPGRRAPVDGQPGLFCASRLVYTSAPEAPHRFESVYIYPDRVRWYRGVEGSRPLLRDVLYRFGTSFHHLEKNGSRSRVIVPGQEQDELLVQMELRRALLAWPIGFDWTTSPSEPDVRTAVLKGGDGTALGAELWAELDGKRPVRIGVHAPDGTEREALEVLAWDADGRPLELRASVAGEAVWTEKIESLHTRVSFLDAFFQPPDRRAGRGLVVGGQAVHSLDVQPFTFRRIELPAETDWEAALEAFEVERERLASTVEAGLDPVPTIELDDQAQPRALLVRLVEAATPAPQGWTTSTERPGLFFYRLPFDALDPGRLQALRKARPQGAHPGRAYARVLNEDGERRLHLILPLESDS